MTHPVIVLPGNIVCAKCYHAMQLQKMCCEPGEKGDMEDEMRKGYRKMQGQNEEE